MSSNSRLPTRGDMELKYQSNAETKVNLKENDRPTLDEVDLNSPKKRPEGAKCEDSVVEIEERRDKLPKRVIHCSDGVVEEFSTDDEDEVDGQGARTNANKAVDPKNLTWVPWMVHYTWAGGSKILAFCDYWGEKLAWTLGITSPKYFYEIEEFKQMQKEEEERKKKEDTELKGWKEQPKADENPVVLDPKSLS